MYISVFYLPLVILKMVYEVIGTKRSKKRYQMPDMRLLDDDRKKLGLQTMISMIEEKLSKSF